MLKKAKGSRKVLYNRIIDNTDDNLERREARASSPERG
jgi:hypothetical protein